MNYEEKWSRTSEKLKTTKQHKKQLEQKKFLSKLINCGKENNNDSKLQTTRCWQAANKLLIIETQIDSLRGRN